MASIFTLGGRTTIDPATLFATAIEQGMPHNLWWGKANSFRSTIGPDAGTGTLLMLRDDIDRLTLSSTHDLVIGDGTASLTLKDMSIINCECASPGLRGDKTGAMIVTIADRRHRIRQIAAGTSYNVRDPSGSGYLSASLNSGTPWTWQQMVDELWDFIDGSSTLTLPYSPDGKPENFSFFGQYAWDALNLIARRLGCGIVYNGVTDVFSMVEVGAADSAAVTALDRIDALRIWDAEPVALANAKMPGEVLISFRNFPPPVGGSSPWLTTVSTLATASPYTDSTVYLDGDMGFPEEAGQSTSSRAIERGAKYYQALSDSVLNPILRVFTGLQKETALFPGKRIKAIAWYDRGNGLKTEIYRGLGVYPPDSFTPDMNAQEPKTAPMEQCRVAGASETHDGIKFFPAYTQELDPDGTSAGVMGFLDVTRVALCQYHNYDLTTGMGATYTARRHARIESVTLGGDPFPVYVTTEFPTKRTNCEDGN